MNETETEVEYTELPEHTWLVQRLLKPVIALPGALHDVSGVISSFGYTATVHQVVADTLRFDYMGSAEFEYGAVGKCLREMCSTPLKAFTYFPGTLPGHRIYVITPGEYNINSLIERINKIIHDECRLKEDTYFRRSVKQIEEGRNDNTTTYGWLELNNGFFFFLNEAMFERCKVLFGITKQ